MQDAARHVQLIRRGGCDGLCGWSHDVDEDCTFYDGTPLINPVPADAGEK